MLFIVVEIRSQVRRGLHVTGLSSGRTPHRGVDPTRHGPSGSTPYFDGVHPSTSGARSPSVEGKGGGRSLTVRLGQGCLNVKDL